MATTATRRGFLRATGTVMGAAVATGGLVGLSAAGADEAERAKVKLVVCSPTGGTMNAGMILAEALSDDVEVIDQTSFASRQGTIEFEPDDLVVMISPTIAGRLPMAEGLFDNLKGNGAPCIAASCFGNRDCEMTNALIAEKATANGFTVIGGIAMVTDHVLGRFLGHGRPDMEDREAIRSFAGAIREKLAAGDLEPVEIVGDESCYENYNPKGTIYKSTTVKEHYPENCIACGVCAQECTAGAIDPQTLEIDEDACIHCQRCTYVCRNQGRYFFPASEFEQGDHYWSRKDIKIYL